MFGIININKPKGKTSHDIVSFIRRTLQERRVGHTGTLDPDAEGVLPILVGKATKLSDWIMSDEKTYVALVQLGVVTDTYDASGTVVRENSVSVTFEEIQQAADGFIGEIEQVPPMYSAIKIDGQKLYALARKGIEVERPARRVSVASIRCFDYDSRAHTFRMEVHCSKGTYIRSLCYDIGEKLGCGAHMAGLVRTRTGSFTIENAHTPDEIETAVRNNTISKYMLSIDELLQDIPRIDISDTTALKIKNGIRLRPEQLGLKTYALGTTYRIYEDGHILCLSTVIFDGETTVFKMEKSFY